MIDINAALCDSCGTCVSVCPVAALFLKDELEVDAALCTSCGRCVNICPFEALQLCGKQNGSADD